MRGLEKRARFSERKRQKRLDYERTKGTQPQLSIGFIPTNNTDTVHEFNEQKGTEKSGFDKLLGAITKVPKPEK